jgi:Uma2 family endonuclease
MAEAIPLNAGASGMPEAAAFAAVTVVPVQGFGQVRIPNRAYTLEGFRQWILSEDAPTHGRFTYVRGELIADMSPESYEKHNSVKVEITSILHRLVRQKKLGRIFGDGVLLSHPAADVSTEPDAMYASFATLRSGRCQLAKSDRPGVAEELLGSPDWVLEIVSPSSIKKDTKELREAYYEAAISEYWLVDVLGDRIQFDILLRGATGFEEAPKSDSWTWSPTFSHNFRLTREIDVDGLWQYTLEIKDNT